MTVSSEVYDRDELEEHAIPETKEVLEDVFQTHYVQTKTPVTYADFEMDEWHFHWERGGLQYRFGVDLWNGNWWLSRKDGDGQYETLLSSN